MEVEVVNSKSNLRKDVLNRRKTILEKDKKDKIITNKLLKNKYIQDSQDILIYISKELEVDTFKLIEELFKLGKNVYAPRITNKIMNFYKINSFLDLKLGCFNILEPTGNDLYYRNKFSCIIVPGLMFDKFNNRLGYGGGYYDKFLSNNNIYKIGVCYSEFKVEKLDVENHDIKMDLVITER